MRISGIALIFCLFVSYASAQPSKTNASTSKPKPSTSKQADTKKKPAATPKKTDTKTAAKAAPAKGQTTKPKTTKPAPAKPKTATTAKAKPKPEPKPVEVEISDEELEAEFQKASTVETPNERIAALKKFIATYPKATRVPDAAAMIVTVHTQVANEMIKSGDMLAALESYEFAIKDAPSPMPDELFTNTLAKFAPNLFFRGARGESFHIAGLIEKKVSRSVPQLVGIANFYMSIENGADARRIAQKAIKLDPASSLAYQTLGLANRMDFLLDESAEAYVKAVELDPESLSARRGLAEMRRALGQADDAVLLYKSIVEKDPADLASQTGLILALFEAEKRSDAETELTKSLEANPGNVILQAGVAYWYATHGEGEKAVDFAQKAIATDPRFIWSHVALARGQIAQGNPLLAERTLIAARRYGNFPTIEYEIASARAAAGLYREAAEELAKSFSVKDGIVKTKLGGRIERGTKNLAELVGYERKASIFAPAPSDPLETGAQLTALLAFKQELDKAEPDSETIGRLADDFSAGTDKMRVHRLIHAASNLLDKKVAVPKVIELAKAAPGSLDAGLDAPDPTAATLASELYEGRILAASRGQVVNVPPVPRATLSAVLRGRVEELSGWAHYQINDAAQASVHLKRAVSVLPADSAWWRTSTWRLGTTLAVEGKNTEALDMYARSYKSGPPDAMKYSVIEALYRRVNGHIMGLEQRIGPNPSPTPSTQTVAERPQPSPTIQLPVMKPTPSPELATLVPTATPGSSPEPTPETIRASETPTPDAKPQETPTAEPMPPTATPTPDASEKPVETPTPTPEPTAGPTPEPSPAASPEATATPEVVAEVKPETTASPTPSPTPEPSPTPSDVAATPAPTKTPADTTVAKETSPPTRLTDNSNGLFPPIVISIPTPPKAAPKASPTPSDSESTAQGEAKPPEPKPATPDGRDRVISGIPAKTEDVLPCTLTLDQETIKLQSGGNERAVVVRRTDDGDVEALTATSFSPGDVSVRREPLPGVKWTALFVLRSVSAKPGLFQVKFESPCGKKEVPVSVQ